MQNQDETTQPAAEAENTSRTEPQTEERDQCIFCGSFNVVERSQDDEEGDETYYWQHCNDCGKDE